MKEHLYELHVLQSIDDFEAWKASWEDLEKRSRGRSFFSNYAFIVESWKRHRSDKDSRPYVILITCDGELKLVMPLVMRRDWLILRKLRWLDTKTPLYCDVLVDQAAHLPTLSAMIREHLSSIRLARNLRVGFVREGSVLAHLLDGMGGRAEPETTSGELDLRRYSGWNDFIGRKSRGSRKYYGRMHRRLGDHGRVAIDQITDPEQLEREIAWIFAEKRDWVRRRFGRDNWLSPAETETLFRSTVIALAGEGRAFVMRLTCNDCRVAAVVVFRDRQVLFGSKIAYDPQWHKYSPGWLLNLELVRLGFEQGLETVDFMLGDDQWKAGFTNEVIDVRRYRLPLGFGIFGVPGSRQARAGGVSWLFSRVRRSFGRLRT